MDTSEGTIRAGFAEVEITPPLGTHKIGWLRDIVGDEILDPLFARVAVLESAGERIAFAQLDTLSVRWTQANDIRQRLAREYGFPPAGVMVSATHNHAGPAVANCGAVPRDDAYVEELTRRVILAFGQALEDLQPAEVGFGTAFEFRVAHNRRVVMRDGSVRTHGTFSDPGALCLEGAIDPEVSVLAARAANGRLLGALVNYACHPTHHGGDTAFSAGYPGVLAREMKERGCPVTLFLNGAAGNMHTSDPAGTDVPMEDAGRMLAEDAAGVIERLKWRRDARFSARARSIALPYRNAGPEEIAGRTFGAQRFIDPALYDQGMPGLLERIRERGTQPAEVQALFVDEVAFVGIPAEYFVELGLRIKEECCPAHALVVGWANGMVGYVPHHQAFARGGYETTFGAHSRMAPEAGDLLADCAIELVSGGG